eukprot:UN03121
MSARSASDTIEAPIQFLRLSLEENVTVECRDNRLLTGTLHAYDEHLNLLLGNCEETITKYENDPESGEKTKIVEVRNTPLLFVRGDGVIVISNSFQ